MSISSENNSTLLSSGCEIIETLKKARDDELKKITKLRLILKIINNISKSKNQLPTCSEQVENLNKIMSVKKFCQLDGGSASASEQLTLLNLKLKEVELPYTARKELRNYLIDEIPKHCLPIINFVQEIQKSFPDALNKTKIQNDFLASEEKFRNANRKLIELKNKKYELLKLCANFKLGPFTKNELEFMYFNYKLNLTKINFLDEALIDQFCNRTEHTLKAIKDITKYIDDEIQKRKDPNSSIFTH